jgi:hypothetical protein
MHDCVSLTEEVDPPPSCGLTASAGGYEQTKNPPSHDFRHVRNPFPKTRLFVRNQKKGHYSLSSPIGNPSSRREQPIGQRGDSLASFDEDDDRPPSARDPRRAHVSGVTDGGRTGSARPRIPAPLTDLRPSAYARLTGSGIETSGMCRRNPSSLSFADRPRFPGSVPFLSRLRFVPSGRLAPPGI